MAEMILTLNIDENTRQKAEAVAQGAGESMASTFIWVAQKMAAYGTMPFEWERNDNPWYDSPAGLEFLAEAKKFEEDCKAGLVKGYRTSEELFAVLETEDND